MCASGPATASRRTSPPTVASNDWVLSLDADERVTPALAAEIRDLMKRGPDARGYRVHASPGTSVAGSAQHGLVSRLSAAPVRPPRRPLERPADPRIVRADRARRDGFASELEHYRLPRHLAPSHEDRSLHDADRGAVGARRAAARTRSRSPCIRRFAFLRNYVLRRGFTDGAAGLVVSVLNSYYVFLKLAKLWELQHRLRARHSTRYGRQVSTELRAPEPRTDPSADVLPAYRHGADLARRAEPGARHRHGPARARASRDARRAPERRAARSARRRARLLAAGAADRDGPLGAAGACRARSSSCGPTSSTRTIRTASRWRRWRCR